MIDCHCHIWIHQCSCPYLIYETNSYKTQYNSFYLMLWRLTRDIQNISIEQQFTRHKKTFEQNQNRIPNCSKTLSHWHWGFFAFKLYAEIKPFSLTVMAGRVLLEGSVLMNVFLLRVLFRFSSALSTCKVQTESQTLEMPLFIVVWFCADAKHISDLT